MPIAKFVAISLLIMQTLVAWSQGTYLMSVTGKVSAKKVKYALAHEHVVTNFKGAREVMVSTNVDSALIKELPYFKALKAEGINVVFECTPAYIGRDVRLLKKISEASGTHIVTNTGFYSAVDKKYLPEFVYNESEDAIAKRWEDEFYSGIDGTNIKPGFIKLGVGDGAIDSTETKLLRAAIKVSKKNGLTIVNHTGDFAAAQSELELAINEGLAPERMVWTHAQNASDTERKVLGEKGMWISLDGVNDTNVDDYVKSITYLKENKLLHRLIISHDDGWSVVKNGSYSQLELFKKGEPYLTITKTLIPILRSKGFSKEEINQLMNVNPIRCFEIGD
jgi:phosphotriesterase-related protein